MGDGIEPAIRGLVTTVASGLVGVIHGALDSTEIGKEAPEAFHYLLMGGVALGSGYCVASSQYGLWNKNSRPKAFVAGASFSGAAQGAGYFVGRVVAEGVKAVMR